MQFGDTADYKSALPTQAASSLAAFKRGLVEIGEFLGGDGARVEAAGPLAGGFVGQSRNEGGLDAAVSEGARHTGEFQQGFKVRDERVQGLFWAIADAGDFGCR